ncbi:flagellar export protein FliJ [Thiomicrorhabdus sp. zzn3]|uniref:flagellar export protein FliJ n=1 Tax=Thiomicrorhabdus sp. zzn3 TaxID=3039775 RepID=UPI002436C629|nr:flagellar export protein FliJ [Thiomicrorhabdus sp. zzn3]MDG6777636.1 flagellar export protein FliJ [Thiomicrorhabdus sp. zzn3]
MSSRIQKIQTLVGLAESEEDKAVKTLAELQGQYQLHAQQLEMLRSYVSDYSPCSTANGSTIQPIQVLSTQAFINKLQDAITAESQKVDDLAHTVERARDMWLEKRSRLKALQKLLLRLEKDEQARINRAEQRFLDELSSQSSYRNS